MWTTKKRESSYADYHGKQILNFQLSILMYSIFLFILAVPTILVTLLSNFSWNEIENGNIILNNTNIDSLLGMGIFGAVCCVLFGILKILEFFYIIYGSIKANEGDYFKYPITINFIK